MVDGGIHLFIIIIIIIIIWLWYIIFSILTVVIGDLLLLNIRTINAVRLKTRLDGFWRPTINNFFAFRPFIFFLKK